jgi:hypothetical protein
LILLDQTPKLFVALGFCADGRIDGVMPAEERRGLTTALHHNGNGRRKFTSPIPASVTSLSPRQKPMSLKKRAAV